MPIFPFSDSSVDLLRDLLSYAEVHTLWRLRQAFGSTKTTGCDINLNTMFCSPTFFSLFLLLILQISASPAPLPLVGDSLALHRRTDPFFPDSPVSCPICEKVSFVLIL